MERSRNKETPATCGGPRVDDTDVLEDPVDSCSSVGKYLEYSPNYCDS